MYMLSRLLYLYAFGVEAGYFDISYIYIFVRNAYNTTAAVSNVSQFSLFSNTLVHLKLNYRGADKSLARPTSRHILFDG
jgi:hypothetical protein